LKDLLDYSSYRVDWNALYDANHYTKQDEIYKKTRPTLLSNTLSVPTGRIREHIRSLSNNSYNGIREQVEAFHRTTRNNSRK
jgi:hypothetical protein